MVFNSYTAEFCRNEVIHTNSPRSLSRSISNRIRIWWVTQRLKADIRQERKALASLPDNLLRDIGITRARLLLRAKEPRKIYRWTGSGIYTSATGTTIEVRE